MSVKERLRTQILWAQCDTCKDGFEAVALLRGPAYTLAPAPLTYERGERGYQHKPWICGGSLHLFGVLDRPLE